MAERTQTARQVSIGTPLGDEKLLFRRATVIENLGRMFAMEVDVFTDQGEVDFSKIVGFNCTIRLEQSDGNQRFFNGFVSRIIHTGGNDRVAHYRLTLSPWLWFLTKTSDCRIFQKMKVPDIIQQIFKDRGFSGMFVADHMHGTYAEREYCVQYRETDFNFVSRLMEEEGIYYYFKHEDGKHTLVLADSTASHEAYPGHETFLYFPPNEGNRDQDYVWDWHVEQEVQPGKYSVTDYHYETPGTDLSGAAAKTREHAAPDLEMFDYHPGRYTEGGDGETLSKIRLDEYQAYHEVIRAKGDVRGTNCGSTFTLDGLSEKQDKEHLITSVVHQLESDEYNSQMEGDSDTPLYECTFSAILCAQQFRPKRITPKPVIYGPQTAFVTGPSGEEIHTDKYGRIKVQFHWDRAGAGDDTSSCWIRVGQVWASKKWGHQFIPRVGQEVIVSFLEGDPDQPLVVGTVYNDDNMPPFALPDNKTISGVKSNSSKGGAGFNEIHFEDKAGEEKIFTFGQKDADTRIQNDCFEWIGHDRHLVVINDQLEEVKNDRHEIVKNNHTEQIGKDRNLAVKGKQAVKVTESHSMTVEGDVIEVFKKNHSEETTADYYLVADNICIEGKTNITIKVGDNFIAIDSKGLKIGTSGKIVLESQDTLDVKSTAAMTIKADATADMSSSATTIKSDGATTIKGATVAIN